MIGHDTVGRVNVFGIVASEVIRPQSRQVRRENSPACSAGEDCAVVVADGIIPNVKSDTAGANDGTFQCSLQLKRLYWRN